MLYNKLNIKNLEEINKIIYENLINIFKQIINKEKVIIETKDNNKDTFIKEPALIYHIGSDYPIHPLFSENPENFYADVYNYLLSRKINSKNSYYPKYLLNSESNIENKKRAFRIKANHFDR